MLHIELCEAKTHGIGETTGAHQHQPECIPCIATGLVSAVCAMAPLQHVSTAMQAPEKVKAVQLLK